jgi:nucleoside-diphosphate-sugar epimerase
MHTILITGGAGFVGRHFTEYFLKQGDTVYCVDNLVPKTGCLPPAKWYFNPRMHRAFRFYQEDCRCFFQRKKLPRFDYVFHLAAIVGGRMLIENNPLAVADDLSIDSELWRWAVRVKPGKMVIFSSSAVYPIEYQKKLTYRLLKEDMVSFDTHLGMPDMSYGWSKLTLEYLSHLAYEKYGIKSVIYRPFSGYGADQDFTYPFPTIMKQIRKTRTNVIKIWGSGKQMRDFIYINDCVQGVIKTMDKIDDASALNLSTGRLTSFIDFVHIAGTVMHQKLVVMPMEKYPEGVFARAGDTIRQRQYGFRSLISLEEGIKMTLNDSKNP